MTAGECAKVPGRPELSRGRRCRQVFREAVDQRKTNLVCSPRPRKPMTKYEDVCALVPTQDEAKTIGDIL